MKVKDIMTKDVAYINSGSKVIEAAKMMQQHNVGSIPVCDQNNSLVGIITDRDIVLRNIAMGKNPANTSVNDVMSPKVTWARPDMDMKEISHLMEQQQVRRIPVVENNKLVGIVALGDMATNNMTDSEASQALTEISRP